MRSARKRAVAKLLDSAFSWSLPSEPASTRPHRCGSARTNRHTVRYGSPSEPPGFGDVILVPGTLSPCRSRADNEDMDELERLQRRAYGPGADIAGDAAAKARLSELEAARRQPNPVVDAPTAPWWRRRRWLAILGSAIAALALIAALIAWMSQLLAPGSTPIRTDMSTAKILPPVPDARGRGHLVFAPDYVLALKSVGADADEPKDPHGTLNLLGLSTDELRRYEDFRGLGVWSGESRYGTACLLVAHPGQGLREGIGDERCSPEGLDTIADLVNPGSDGYNSGGVFADLTNGSLIRFVLNGDHVDVHLYMSATDPIASQG